MAADQLRRRFSQQFARLLDRVEIAPVITDGSDKPRFVRLCGDRPRCREVGRQRFFDKEWQVTRDDIVLDRAVRERRHAYIYRVGRSAVEQLAMVRVGTRAIARRGA